MTQADIENVFTFKPLMPEQESDLKILHQAGMDLAMAIYRVMNPQAAQLAVSQLTAIVSQCRMAIELTPRQGERKIQLMS